MGKNAGLKGFTASVFIDKGEETTKVAAYSFRREPSSQGIYRYAIEAAEEKIHEDDREKINQKIAELLKPVLYQLREDGLWNEK